MKKPCYYCNIQGDGPLLGGPRIELPELMFTYARLWIRKTNRGYFLAFWDPDRDRNFVMPLYYCPCCGRKLKEKDE